MYQVNVEGTANVVNMALEKKVSTIHPYQFGRSAWTNIAWRHR